MMQHYALPVLTGTLAVFCARPVFADDPSCSSVTIDAEASVSTRWPGLLNQVREAFEGRDDIDRCARVELRVRDASITVEVVLPDGRSAERPVSRREDVVPTLEALLLVPQRSAQAPTPSEASDPRPPPADPMPVPSSASPPSTRTIAFDRDRAVSDRDGSAPLLGHPRSRLRIELSVATGARIGDGQTSVGLGALSFLELSGWLVGFEGRADRYQTLAGAFSGGALELALLGGRRFRFHNMALDLTAGPAAVMHGTSTFSTTSPSGSNVTESSSSTVPRLLLGARVSFSALSTIHSFVGIDGELGPPAAGDEADLPHEFRLPVWTLGLALGATVGTQ
jgi:hypothetical protein